MEVLQMGLVSIPHPLKRLFVCRITHCGTLKCVILGQSPNGVASIQNFIRIHLVTQLAHYHVYSCSTLQLSLCVMDRGLIRFVSDQPRSTDDVCGWMNSVLKLKNGSYRAKYKYAHMISSMQPHVQCYTSYNFLWVSGGELISLFYDFKHSAC